MKTSAPISFLLTAIALVFFASCKKETIELLTQEVNSNTTLQLTDVVFANDSVGFACGGDRWSKGIILRTTDGGHTWSSPDSLFDHEAYSLYAFSADEVYIAGGNSYFGHSLDSGKTFSIKQSDYKRIFDIAFADHNRLVKVGAENAYADGHIAYSSDAGLNWTKTDYLTAMTCVQFADNSTAFASGYGVVYRSTDGGANFEPLDVRGDFFLGLSFPSSSTGYVAGYEKLILKTTDGGNSWKRVMRGNAPFSAREHFRTIKFWDDNNGFVCGDGGIMYQTNNGGDSWKKVKQFTDVNLMAIHLFSATDGIVVGDGGKIFLFKAPQ